MARFSLTDYFEAVPSVIIPNERNYLLNPKHPHFARIHIAKPENFAFDLRLLA